MIDFQFSETMEAEFTGLPKGRPELAEFDVAADETRIASLIVRAEDIQAGSASRYSEERTGARRLQALHLGFLRGRHHVGLRPGKIRRVFIPRVRQANDTPAELSFSQRTLDLVRSGFVLRASSFEDLLDNNPEVFEASDEQISTFIRQQLLLTLGGVAYFLTQYEKPNFTLAYDGNFIGAIDLLLQSRIPNVPKDFNLLSDSICSDIVRHLRDAGRIQAVWGELRMNGSGVVLVATGTPVSPPEPRGRAKLLE
jgi:hypothetical protein